MCVLQKAAARVGTKALNVCHQAKQSFRDIFVGIAQHQKLYLVCVPHKLKIVPLYNVVFDESVSSMLAYTSNPYKEAIAV